MMHSPLIQAHKVALKAVSEFKVKLYFIRMGKLYCGIFLGGHYSPSESAPLLFCLYQQRS